MSTVTQFFEHVLQTSLCGVSLLGFRFEAHFLRFMHSVSSKFYSKTASLTFPHKSSKKRRPSLSFLSTYFKRPFLGFPNWGFDLKHTFSVLCTPFLRNSILNHQAKSFHTKVSKNINHDSVF